MSKLDTLRQNPAPSHGEKNPEPAGSLDALRAEARRRLRRETVSTVMTCAVMVALVMLTFTESLPALRGSMFSSNFIGGFLTGGFAVAATLSVRQVMSLRRALADDRELRRYFARENDELTAHMEREIARTFVRAIPLLAVVAIFVGALVSFEAMVAVAATLVFLATALLAVKLSYRARYRTGAETE
mgnify:FL=1